ncbi:tripartite tricarboxylate transporter substrate binding protein [uncultured Ilyobacter sp.]|uniref:tripartite tricarboxylate transporter substrate binding protein n=1 Tax=uncultured Ilyobacter sp. TaxID=544433 RepID=UPI0029C732D2|nr:tripartite tricarboxylate transporter substrate binding protein [uncultured Ilyobacter sp.]
MKRRFKNLSKLFITALSISALVLTGCGKKDAGTTYPSKPMTFIAPGGAGGGWDGTIRTVAKVLKDTKLVDVPMPVTNKPGGGGGVALAYLQELKGDAQTITVYSPPLILINLNGSSKLSYKDVTPIARLITDYGAFVVKKGSKYKTIADVMDALKKDPKSVKIGGGSSAGSMDHIQFLMIAKAAGVKNLKEIDYLSFQEGGANAQLLGGHIDLLTTGLGDVAALLESGQLVGLAQTADERVGEGVLAEIPTCKESGIDAAFYNWRGLFGAPDMPEEALKYWEDTLAKMVETPEWDEAVKRNGWTKSFANSADFSAFLDKTNEEYKEIMAEIGLLK